METKMETTLWHELDDQTSETISGGGVEGDLAWSIRFGDLRRSTNSSKIEDDSSASFSNNLDGSQATHLVWAPGFMF